jgi:hypothetical protein
MNLRSMTVHRGNGTHLAPARICNYCLNVLPANGYVNLWAVRRTEAIGSGLRWI